MAQEVGGLYYDLEIKDGKLKAQLAQADSHVKGFGDSAGSKMESATNAIGNAMSKMGTVALAGVAATGVAIAALTTKMLLSGAELEQQLGGSQAVFGEYAKNIQETAATAYKNMGLSQNEFLQGANRMGSLYQGAGISVQQSMKMSSDAIQRATDVASIMGIDTTVALESVTAMAKGNFTMMDNLGVAMNDTALNAYALEKGLGKTTQQMSQAEKVGLATQLFMEKTAKYAGNYAKENDTLAGSLNTTKKAFDDFMSGGGDIDGFITSLINTIKIAVPQIIQILPRIVEGIGAVIEALGPAIAEGLPKLVPALVTAATQLFQMFVTQLPTVIQVLVNALPQFIQGFVQIFIALVKALPQIVTILANAMPTVINALVEGLTNPTALTAIIMGAVQLLLAIVQAIPIIINALTVALPVIIQNMITVLTSPVFINAMMQAGVALIKALIKGVVSIAVSVAKSAWDIIKIYADLLSPSSLANIGANMMRGLWNGISNLTGWIIDKIKGFGNSVIKSIKGIFGIKSPSKVFAGIGENLGLGMVKGIDGMAGQVQDALTSLAAPTIGMSIAGNAAVSPVAGAAGVGYRPEVAAQPGIGGTINIGTVNIDNEKTADYFFKKLGRNQELTTKGLATQPGSVG